MILVQEMLTISVLLRIRPDVAEVLAEYAAKLHR